MSPRFRGVWNTTARVEDHCYICNVILGEGTGGGCQGEAERDREARGALFPFFFFFFFFFSGSLTQCGYY